MIDFVHPCGNEDAAMMLERAQTYEEAIEIIKNSTTSIICKHNKRAFKLRIAISFIIGLSTSVLVGIMVNSISATIATLPIYGIIFVFNILPYLLYLRNLRRIMDESYFKKMSEEEAIESANEYVEAYNDYVLQLEREKRLQRRRA